MGAPNECTLKLKKYLGPNYYYFCVILEKLTGAIIWII